MDPRLLYKDTGLNGSGTEIILLVELDKHTQRVTSATMWLADPKSGFAVHNEHP